MSSSFGKVLAVICGVFLAIGILCCFFVKSDDLIGTVVIFALVYVVYLIVLSKKLRQKREKGRTTPPKGGKIKSRP